MPAASLCGSYPWQPVVSGNWSSSVEGLFGRLGVRETPGDPCSCAEAGGHGTCAMDEEQGILSQLKLSCDAEGTFFSWLTYKEKAVEGFQIKLTDAETAWAGEVSAEVLQADATESGLAVEDYADELLTALRGDPAYEVELQSASSSQSGVEKQLAVCKRHEDVTFELGVVPLHGMASAPSLARQMLACSLKRLATMDRDHATLCAENERLADERRTAINRLEKYVQAKEEMERDLYSKFHMLLNQKKKKIQALSESLQKVEAERANLDDVASAGEEDAERPEYEESTEEDTPPQSPLDTPCPNPPEPGEKPPCLFGDALEEMLAPTKRRRMKQPAVTWETAGGAASLSMTCRCGA
uniref:DNA repair protein XRCC4 isoform X2 n=1 Tax=Myxine glutinosa TaxID=7769 RepID=UPI00358FA410